MENLFYNISQVLGITIIHSLWQGLVIYIVMRLIVQLAPNMSSAIRYKVAFAGLGTLALWFAGTLFAQINSYTWLATVPPYQVMPIVALFPFTAKQHWVAPVTNSLIAGYLPYITVIYLTGLVFNTLKISLAWNNIYRIRQNATVSSFQQQVSSLSLKLNVSKKVQAAFSQFIDVPCVTGFFKPVILLPFGLSTYLSANEIEAILIHELAHIRRNDYLANIIQQAISILLFFNPFSLMINRIINHERENCCDDNVVQTTGSPLIYAQALLKLEQNKQPVHQLTLAATGKKYHLLNRIERIMETKKTTLNIRPALIVVLLLTFSLSSIAWFAPKNDKVYAKKAFPITAALPAATPPTVYTSNMSLPAVYPKTPVTAVTPIDTLKNKSKIKIVVEDDKGNKKEYNSLSEMPDDVKTNFYQQNAMGSSKMADSIKNYYTSPQFQKQIAEIQSKAMAMGKKMNSPEFKKQIAQIQKQAMEIASKVNTPQFKKQIAEIQKQGEAMGRYYDSPEGKKRLEDLQKKAENIGKQFDNPEFLKQMDSIGAYFDSPEFQKKVEEMTKSLDNIDFNKNIDQQNKYKAEFQKKLKKTLVEAKYDSSLTNEQMKAKIAAEQKALFEDLNKAVKAKEKAEKKELKEQKEKPEQPEQPEQPDISN